MNRKVSSLPSTHRSINSFSPVKKKGWKLAAFITIPISFFLGFIIVIPTIVVQVDRQIPTGGGEAVEEQVVFNEVNVSTPLIEVSIERNETKEIETVALEQYVASVVASEMPATFEIDALKAQAIAARTYIINHLLHEKEEIISDTVNHQVYRNKDELQSLWGTDFYWKWEKINRAVKATENLIITYNDEPITPTFFSMSNGFTEDAEHYWGNELPYLKSVESKWEEALPNFITQEIFTRAELNELLQIDLSQASKTSIKIQRTPSERVDQVELAGREFSGREIREKLNLRSTDFTIEQRDEHFVFTTKGYGHGVGMSQHGANGMATEGKSYLDILKHYYKDIDITEITESVPSLVATNK
ncbi:MAG TPA: stage II sporulation protein D [Pseudogracilibacillus sp.]|nr:stage II sporulation protein D [Pseudogracilibacillus sp.]